MRRFRQIELFRRGARDDHKRYVRLHVHADKRTYSSRIRLGILTCQREAMARNFGRAVDDVDDDDGDDEFVGLLRKHCGPKTFVINTA